MRGLRSRTMGVRFRVLGALEAEFDDRDPSGDPEAIDLGWRRQRTLLALLIIARGEVLSVERLVDALWQREPPFGAVGALQVEISRLRRALEPARAPRAPASLLRTQAPGYTLSLPADAVDAWRFESMVASVDGSTDLVATRLVLDRALALWHGSAYAEVADQPWALHEIARLGDLRAVARGRLVTTLLAAGNAGAAVAAANDLTRDDPRREEGWRLLATALAHDGRQADALDALYRARCYLRDQAGLEPGPALSQLEHDLLNHDIAVPRTAIAANDGDAHQDGFVGRRTELEALVQLAQTASHRRDTQVALLTGEPGAGKSRLLARLGNELALRGWTVASARCPESEGAAPLALWAQVAKTLTADGTAASASVARLVDPRSDADPERDLPAGRVALRRGLGELITDVAHRRPLVLMLDDLQGADSETMALSAGIVEDLTGAAVLVVASTRPSWPGAGGPDAAVALAHLAPSRVDLTGFGPGEAAELVSGVTGSPVDVELAEALVERTAGNALYLTELARLLRTDGSFAARSRVPDGVRDVIRRRLGLLRPATVEVLCLAAVVGVDVAVEVLADAAETTLDGCDARQVTAALEDGVQAGLLEEPTPGLVRFAHVIVRETLYDQAPLVRRSRWHAAIAGALAELRPDDVAARAHHLLRSGTSAGARAAVDAATLAAHQAMARFAPERAIELFGQAVRALDRLDEGHDVEAERVELLSCRSRAELAAGAGTAALATRTEAVQVAERSGDARSLVGALAAWDLPTLWTTRTYGTSDPWLVGLLERSLRVDGVEATTRVRLLCAIVREVAGADQQRAHAASFEAEAIARDFGDAFALGLALHARAVVLLHDSDLAGRIPLADELLAIGEAPELAKFALVGHELVVQWALANAEISTLVEHLGQMETLVATYRWRQADGVVAMHHGVLALLLGDLAAAETHYGSGVAMLRRNGGLDVDPIAGLVAFTLAVARGDTSVLVPLIDSLGAVPRSMTDLAVVVLADAGRLDDAQTIWATRAPIEQDFFRSLKLAGRALAVLRLGAADEAAAVDAALGSFAGQLAGAVTGAFAFPPVDLLRGDLALLLGRPAQAAERYGDAARLAARCGSPLWMAEIADRQSALAGQQA